MYRSLFQPHCAKHINQSLPVFFTCLIHPYVIISYHLIQKNKSHYKIKAQLKYSQRIFEILKVVIIQSKIQLKGWVETHGHKYPVSLEGSWMGCALHNYAIMSLRVSGKVKGPGLDNGPLCCTPRCIIILNGRCSFVDFVIRCWYVRVFISVINFCFVFKGRLQF